MSLAGLLSFNKFNAIAFQPSAVTIFLALLHDNVDEAGTNVAELGIEAAGLNFFTLISS